MRKKILVTGADGFIGSHLVEALMDHGDDVRAFCYYNSFNSWGWLDTFPADKKKSLEIFMGDIRDSGSVRTAMKDVDTVFHLAALIGIPYSYYSPESYVDTNIQGTLNVLQAARDFKTKKVLVTSTSEVYGTARYVPIDEEHPRQGQSPYAATKIGADSLASSFYDSFGLPLTIVRPFNTYGPRQSGRAVIPSIITQLLQGHSKIKLGYLDSTRDFVYVKDTAMAFLKIAQTESLIGQEVNVATGKEISIGQLAQELIKQINPRAEIVTEEVRLRPEKSEVLRLLGSNEKLIKHAGWQPEYDLQKGLAETIAWFRNGENLSRYKSEMYNI